MAFIGTIFSTWSVACTALLFYLTGLCVYRRFFHPLAKVPGPFLPAVTILYQTYFNRKYYREIDRLHEIYGPVVRINPDEVHLSDPDNYDKIYHVGSKYAKAKDFYSALCIPQATFGTISNEKHRITRAAMNPMFSRKMVLSLERIVRDKVNKVCALMQRGLELDQPVDIHHAARAVSVDVITDYAFDKSYELLERSDLGAHFFDMVRGLGPAFYFFQLFPSLQPIACKIPYWLAPYLSAPLGCVTGFQEDGRRLGLEVKRKMAEGKLDRPTIFSTLLSPGDKLAGYQIPSDDVLKQQAYSIMAAAADTTGAAIAMSVFEVLNHPDMYAKLSHELVTAFPHPKADLDFVRLEQLPYLTAVIKEGLRLSFGVPSRLARTVPVPGASFNGCFIPGGYTVGMSSWMMHRNPAVFSDPMSFSPERWMDPEQFRVLDRHMVPFGRGSRQCVGMPLAYCELYVAIGTFFRRFPSGLKVYKTTYHDMEFDDFFASYNISGRNWLRVVGESYLDPDMNKEGADVVVTGSDPLTRVV